MRKKASITVFAALSLMLVAQLLFTLLEAARHYELQKVLYMNTDTVLESVFADYCSPLWETYKILGVRVDDTEGKLCFNNREAQLRGLTSDHLGSKEQKTLLSGISLLTAEMTDARYDPYRLLTDQNGVVFQKAVCTYMKKNIAYEMAKSVYNHYEAVKEVKKDYKNPDEGIADAMDALKHPEKYETGETGKAGNSSSRQLKGAARQSYKIKNKDSEETGAATENPLETVTEVKKDGVLSLVLPENARVSGKSINIEETVSHRSLEKGTMDSYAGTDWYQKVLFHQYLVNYLGNYVEKQQDRVLEYELEYVLGGKANDAENLKIVVSELLAMREPLNMASLTASSQRQSEAMALAVTLAGASANPTVIEAVKYGILVAWAFAESVLDVRTLLSGGKITMIKSDADWTSNVHMIPELLSGWSVAKDCSQGLDYGQYAAILLLFHKGNTLAMRTMDVEEAYVQTQEGYENFQMDHVLCETELTATYEFQPVFLGFVSILENFSNGFRIQNHSGYSYFHGKEGM